MAAAGSDLLLASGSPLLFVVIRLSPFPEAGLAVAVFLFSSAAHLAPSYGASDHVADGRAGDLDASASRVTAESSERYLLWRSAMRCRLPIADG